jgi:hypothetical protein
LVIRIDDKKLIDPSYEIDGMTDVEYLEDIYAFQKSCSHLEGWIGNGFKYTIDQKKEIIKNYLYFVNIANEINEGNEITACQTYSINLSNYVMNKFNEKNIFSKIQVR